MSKDNSYKGIPILAAASLEGAVSDSVDNAIEHMHSRRKLNRRRVNNMWWVKKEGTRATILGGHTIDKLSPLATRSKGRKLELIFPFLDDEDEQKAKVVLSNLLEGPDVELRPLDDGDFADSGYPNNEFYPYRTDQY